MLNNILYSNTRLTAKYLLRKNEYPVESSYNQHNTRTNSISGHINKEIQAAFEMGLIDERSLIYEVGYYWHVENSERSANSFKCILEIMDQKSSWETTSEYSWKINNNEFNPRIHHTRIQKILSFYKNNSDIYKVLPDGDTSEMKLAQLVKAEFKTYRS